MCGSQDSFSPFFLEKVKASACCFVSRKAQLWDKILRVTLKPGEYVEPGRKEYILRMLFRLSLPRETVELAQKRQTRDA